MAKRCSKCGEDKGEDEFHRWNRRDGRQVYCKDCRRMYDAAYHQRVKERRREQKRRRARELREFMRSLKDAPCADCGQRFDPAAMQWDHLPGFVKSGNLGDIGRKASRQTILAEIAKCDLVCANCHAIRTVRRRAGRSSAW